MSIITIENGDPAQGTSEDDSVYLINTPSGRRTLLYEGNDDFWGSLANDEAFGNQGRDTLLGSGGNDSLNGGKDDDVLNGGISNDFLFGNFGVDDLTGDDGNDSLFGGRDNDELFGGQGDDWLSGDRGFDVMSGDDGRDTFVLQEQDDNSYDYINDFTQGIDRIQLQGGISFSSLQINTFAELGMSEDSMDAIAKNFSSTTVFLDDSDILVRIRGTGKIIGILDDRYGDLAITPASLTAADFTVG